MDDCTNDTTYARPRPGRRTTAENRHALGNLSRRQIVVLSVAAIAALLVLAVAIDLFASAGRVHPGVSVGGVDIGGKKPDTALALLKMRLPAKQAAVTVARGDKTWTVKPEQVGATFDYAALVAEAQSVGRSGGFFSATGQRVRSWAGGTKLPAPAIADSATLNAVVEHIAGDVNTEPRDAALKVSASGVVLKPSATGLTVDTKLLATQVVGALGVDAARSVAVSAAVTQPRISDAAAKQAQAVAERMIGDSATVTYGAKSWPLSTAEIASMVSVRSDVSSASAEAGSLVPSIDVKRAEKVIVPKVGAALGSQPVDAKFVAEGTTVRLVPSKDGVGPDIADFSANLTTALQSQSGTRSVELRTKVTSPSITTTKAEAMGIRERISAFTTEYKGGLPARVNNVRVLAAALDGKLVAPGGTFSLNEAVGERTASKGYQEANAIVKGKLVPQMGGGICQVATTFFNTVFMSGLPITERVPHSFYIAHYPMGRDCTVSWGGPDFKWKNTTSNWVLVSAGLVGDKVTVSLYGTSPGYTVAFTTTPFSNDVPFKTTKVSDPTLAVGTQKVVEAGLNGGKAVVVRTVKQGSTVVRTDTFASSYVPVAQTVAVGALKAASKPAAASLPPKKR